MPMIHSVASGNIFGESGSVAWKGFEIIITVYPPMLNNGIELRQVVVISGSVGSGNFGSGFRFRKSPTFRERGRAELGRVWPADNCGWFGHFRG